MHLLRVSDASGSDPAAKLDGSFIIPPGCGDEGAFRPTELDTHGSASLRTHPTLPGTFQEITLFVPTTWHIITYPR
jgi:hypothetical protein